MGWIRIKDHVVRFKPLGAPGLEDEGRWTTLVRSREAVDYPNSEMLLTMYADFLEAATTPKKAKPKSGGDE